MVSRRQSLICTLAMGCAMFIICLHLLRASPHHALHPSSRHAPQTLPGRLPEVKDYTLTQDRKSRVCAKGPAPFTMQHLRDEFAKFIAVYDNRPRAVNRYGSKMAHQFAMFVAVRYFKPRHIIESGVFKGLGSWMLRQAAPDAQLVLLDPEANHLAYTDRHKDTIYLIQDQFADFGELNFRNMGLDPARTLVYFDDHQNAIKRTRQAHKKGFKLLMFDDNNEIFHVDSTTLKQAISLVLGTNTTEIKYKDDFGQIEGDLDEDDMHNINDTVNSIINTYYEFPFPYNAPAKTGEKLYPDLFWDQIKEKFNMKSTDDHYGHVEFKHVCLVTLK